MAEPLVPYVIRDGDYLSKLAYTRGFDADKIWNDPKNDEIRKLRKREVLCTGDVLYVPKKRDVGLGFDKRTVNRFVAKVPTTAFHMRFDGAKGPLANEKFTFTIEGIETEGTTDGDGNASFELPITCAEVLIVFPDKGFATTSKVGHLDPIEDPSGVRQRLKNKGYIKGPPTEDEDREAKTLADGISAFQKEQKLEPTGEMDDATQAKLKEIHGS